MLVSILRNIGLATIGELGDLGVLLEEQAGKLRNIKRIINCRVDISSNVFELETIDFATENVVKLLPGLQIGSVSNLSPFVPIRTPRDKISFESIEAESLINFDRIGDFDKYGGQLSDKIPVTFSLWLAENKNQLILELYNYYKENYLTSADEKEILMSDAPRFLVFSFKLEDTYKFPGEIESFKELYLILKKAQTSDVQQREEMSSCLGCGINYPNLIPLKDLKFFDFFSLDQPMFWLGFQKSNYQALICSECEKLIRKGYQTFDTLLKFEAYKLKVSEKEWQIIYHSILPLFESSERLKSFIDGLSDYRKEIYESERLSIRKKLESLVSELEYVSKNKKKELEKRIIELEKRGRDLEERGIIQASRRVSEIKLLKEAAKRKTGLMDFYYREESYPGGKKKVVKDIIYGNKQRITQIVKWLEETQNEFGGTVYFDLKILVNIFGEKMGRLIFQSLFTGKKIYEKELFHAAYQNLWKLFRKYQISKEKLRYEERFYLRQGIRTLHFTISLLHKAVILR